MTYAVRRTRAQSTAAASMSLIPSRLHEQALAQAAHGAFVLVGDPLMDDVRGAPHPGPVDSGGVDVADPVAPVLDEIVLGAERQSHPVTPGRAAKSPATGGCALAHGGAASSSAATRMASSGALP